mgnify:CR=1 FL=1
MRFQYSMRMPHALQDVVESLQLHAGKRCLYLCETPALPPNKDLLLNALNISSPLGVTNETNIVKRLDAAMERWVPCDDNPAFARSNVFIELQAKHSDIAECSYTIHAFRAQRSD